MLFKDIINPYNYLSKNDNFSIKTPRAVEARGEGGGGQGGPGPPNFLNTDVFIIDDSKTKKKLEKS